MTPPLVVSLDVPFVVPLIDASVASLLGGKGSGLVRLLAAGFAVPRGLVLTTAAFAEDGTLLPAAMAQKTQMLQEMFATQTPALFAVRSSATVEDGAAASFAGLFDTVLNVAFDDLDAAIARVRASGSAEHVRDYQTQMGLPPSPASLAVIVQEQVAAVCAGVVFTVHPTRGRDDEMVVETVRGLGDALVSGRARPDRAVVRLPGLDVTFDVVADPQAGPALSASWLRTLAEQASAMQSAFGVPLDIEWAFDGERLWFLQARPVTRIELDVVGEWTTADFRDGGVSSSTCAPFLWSLYERAFDDSMEDGIVDLRLRRRDPAVKWTRVFFGRPYWNVGEVKRALSRMPGYRERDLDVDLGITPRYDGDGRTTSFTPTTLLRALPVAAALSRSFPRRLQKNEALRARLADEIPRWRDVPETGFGPRYRALLELQHEVETNYFDTIYTSSNARLELKGTLKRVQAACVAAGEAPLDFAVLVGGLRDLSHLRPIVELHDIVSGLQARNEEVTDDVVAAFAARFWHHSRRELDLAVPRWPDDLDFVREVMNDARARLSTSHDPRGMARVTDEQHGRALAERERGLRVLRRRPLLRRSFVSKLERVRLFAWWREEMRDLSTQLYALVRSWTLAAAQRLVNDGHLAVVADVWCLRAEEVHAALAGEVAVAVSRARVAEGRRVLLSFAQFSPPGEIGRRPASLPVPAPTAGGLRGTGCSGGRAVGRVRVARTIDEARGVLEGEILVAAYTDPGWTPLFSRIAAVVTETGGLLSHAAVIAREVGIPAVLAVADATSVLKTGDTVVVDGAAGTVERQ